MDEDQVARRGRFGGCVCMFVCVCVCVCEMSYVEKRRAIARGEKKLQIRLTAAGVRHRRTISH